MKRFHLLRNVDVTGVSGTGVVAEGVVFTDGTTVMRWFGSPTSTGIFSNIGELMAIHDHQGTEHEGKNKIVWLD